MSGDLIDVFVWKFLGLFTSDPAVVLNVFFLLTFPAAALTAYLVLRWLSLSRAAAQLRATTGVNAPDALQLGAALAAGCRTFVTNNRRIPAIPGLREIQLSGYVQRR